MPIVELQENEVLEAVCRMLRPIILMNALPDQNRYGVDILNNKKDPYLKMLHFITQDMLEVNLEFDFHELETRGKEYIDHIHGLLLDQLEKAREERQKDNSLTIYPDAVPEPKPKPTALAVSEIIH